MLVHELGLTQAQYGYVVSAFGLSKLLGNLPAATLVDRYGRRAMMCVGLAVTGVGMGGVGLTDAGAAPLDGRFAGYAASS